MSHRCAGALAEWHPSFNITASLCGLAPWRDHVLSLQRKSVSVFSVISVVKNMTMHFHHRVQGKKRVQIGEGNYYGASGRAKLPNPDGNGRARIKRDAVESLK